MTDLSQRTPRPVPDRTPLVGRYVRLEPFEPHHAAPLFAAYAEDREGAMWDYLPAGPFDDAAAYRAWFDAARSTDDPLHYAVRMADGRLGGSLALMRIVPDHGVIEAGWLTFAPRLQRTREASEAVILLMRWAFEAGYRRFEWKCDAANAASRRAAQRFGLAYEGTFRKHRVVKGRNRDTAWYAALDSDWRALRQCYDDWLAPGNFDAAGRQRTALSRTVSAVRR